MRVLPVHTFFTTGANSDFQMDYEYLDWKYAAVLATTQGGFTATPTFSTDVKVYCGTWPLGTEAYACTDIGEGTVVFGTSTFTSSENQAASIIGHELLHTTAKLRCDGLVEVCYEISGVEAWGMLREPDGAVHYDITDQSDQYDYRGVTGQWEVGPDGESDSVEEHNDFDTLWNDWLDTLMPATQCGYVTPIDGATRFQRQTLCLPVGSKGGNP